jgi:hypothetical protein
VDGGAEPAEEASPIIDRCEPVTVMREITVRAYTIMPETVRA